MATECKWPYIVYGEKSAIIIIVFLCNVSFSLFCFWFSAVYPQCLVVLLSALFVVRGASWICKSVVFISFLQNLGVLFLLYIYIFCFNLIRFSFLGSYYIYIKPFNSVHRYLRFCSFSFHPFFLCSSNWSNAVDLFIDSYVMMLSFSAHSFFFF